MIKPLFQRILVAYNGSKSSLHSVMYAIIMAKCYNCKVKVVYVIDTEAIKRLSIAKFIVDEESKYLEESLETDGKNNLKYAVELAKSKGILIDVELRKGAIWSEVIKAADDYKAELILLGGTQEVNYYERLSKDSTSMQNSEIIGSAHCSVMVVRQPYIEQLFKIA